MVDYEGFVSRVAGNDKRFFTILACALTFVIAVLMIFKQYSDVEWYYLYAETFANGQIPYEVYDNIAYPPMFLYISVLPALITDSLDIYVLLYLLMSTALVLVAAHYALKMCDEYGVSHLYVYIVFLLMMACVPVHCIDRNDGMATIIAMLAMFMFLKKRDSLCFVLLAVSIMIKIYPGLVMGAFLIPFLINRDWKRCFGYFLLTMAVCVLIQVPCYIASPDSSFNYLVQNSGRPLQIESCVSVLVMIYMAIFPDKVWIEHTDDHSMYTFGSDNFRGAFPDALADIMMPLMIIAIIVTAIYFLYRLKGHRLDREHAMAVSSIMAFILVLIFLLLNKVYSAQYGLWPVLLFMPVLMMLQHLGVDSHKLTEKYILFGFATLVATILFDGYAGPLFFLATLFKTVALILLLKESLHMFSTLVSICGSDGNDPVHPSTMSTRLEN